MATKEQKSAVLHSNGEKYPVEGKEATERLINGFPHMPAVDVDATKRLYIGSADGSAFIEVTMGDSDFKLDEKPQCNDYLDCDKPDEPAKPDKPAEKKQ